MATISAVIRWADNTAQLQRNLEEGLDQIEAMTKSADKLARSLSNDSIAAAHKWAAAVEKIGGVTTLTTSQKSKMNGVLKEALDKYEALGKTAPSALVRMEAATRQVEKPTQQLGLSVKTLVASYLTGQAIWSAATSAFRSLVGVVTDSLKEYAAAEAAQKKLTVALNNQGQAAPEVGRQFSKMASEFQRTTVYSDDLIVEMQALLVQVGGVMPSQMKRALAASTDLASGLGIDLRAATMLVGKAFAGETGSLSRYGIIIDQTALKSKGVEAVLDSINSKFGGQARGEIDTYNGRLQQLTNTWDNFLESMGRAIAEDPILKAFLSNASSYMQSFAAQTEDAEATFSRFIVGAATGRSPVALQLLDIADASARAFDNAMKLRGALEDLDTIDKGALKASIMPAKLGLPAGSQALVQETLAGWKSQTQAMDAAAKTAQRLREELRSMAAAFRGATAIEAAEKMLKAIAIAAEEGVPVMQMTRAAQDQINQTMKAAIDVYAAQGRVAPEAIRRVYDETKNLLEIQKEFAALIAKNPLSVLGGVQSPALLTDTFKAPEPRTIDLRTSRTSTLPIAKNPLDILNGLPGGLSLGPPPSFLKRLSADFGGFFKKDLAGIVMGALQGGGNVSKSIGGALGGLFASGSSAIGKSLTNGLSGMLGKGLGGALGSVLPGIGTMIGSFLGSKLGGVFGNLFGGKDKKATEQIRTMQAELLKTHGSLDEIRRMGQLVGVNLADAWGAKGQSGLKSFTALAEEFQRKQEQLTGALERYGLTWLDVGQQARQSQLDQVAAGLVSDFEILKTAGVDVTKIVGGMSTAINKFLTDALTTGATIPPAMKPMIEQLIRTGQLTEQNAALMLGMKHEAVPAWADVKAAAERYGIALDSLGPKIEQIRITEEANQIVKDWEFLIGAGADAGAVMAGMADDVQKLITAALKSGLELPASMKPMLEQMMQAGLLTDDTGEKLTTLSGIKFAEPLSASVDRLIEALDKLVASLNGDVNRALDHVARDREFVVRGRVEIRDPQTQVPGGSMSVDEAHSGAFVGMTGIQRHHQGIARVLKFHSGVANLASDEVPAILQVGESVLNRRATQQIGPDAIRALNTGRAGGSGAPARVEVRTAALERELAALRQDVRDGADRTYRAIRDAVAQGAA